MGIFLTLVCILALWGAFAIGGEHAENVIALSCERTDSFWVRGDRWDCVKRHAKELK